MRPRAQLSAAGVIIVVLIALLGFAAVSAENPTPPADTTSNDALPASLSARVAAASFSASLNPTVAQQAPAATPQVAASPRVEPVPAPTTTTTTTTTTAPPPTTTAAPTTTTAAPPPPTTTTTTTTAPPTTTTTTEPPSTTTTEPPVPGGVRDVEEWRSLVEQYFAAEMVDGALTVIACESNGDPLAENPYSGASGLFQFIPTTWAWASAGAGFADASPFDPVANVAAAGWVVQRSLDRGNHPWDHWTCRP